MTKASVCSMHMYQKRTRNYFFSLLFLGQNMILGSQQLGLFDFLSEGSNYFFFEGDERNRIERYLHK